MDAALIDRSVLAVRSNAEECIGCGECIKACPLGAADFNDQKEVAFICDLCDGEPICVDNWVHGALSSLPIRSVARRKRRGTAQSHTSGECI